jgi:hypothetical protein
MRLKHGCHTEHRLKQGYLADTPHRGVLGADTEDAGRKNRGMVKFTRTTPRFEFTAPARIFRDGDVQTATVKELSQNGCFLEFSAPYPAGTDILLRIFSDDEIFEAAAKVIYAKPGLGMAVAFRDVKNPFMETLQRWSLTATRKGETSIP